MAQVTFVAGEAGLVLRVDGGAPADRFEARVDVFVDDDTATAPEKILARQDLASGDLVMHGWIKQGVLVLAIFRRFKAGDARSNFFDREFFYLADRPL
jgi:hypothetical protein